jgi:hypothetical protein
MFQERKKPIVTKLRMLSGPKDLDNLKRLGALKIPESETGDKD